MATNSLKSIHSLRHSIDSHSPRAVAASCSPHYLFRRPKSVAAAVCRSISHSPSAAAYTATNPSTSGATSGISLDLLERHLSSKDFRQADEETRRLLIALAGEAAERRGYVFFSEVQFIPAGDFHAIDALWREHSDGRYGYSVQRRIWKKVKGDFTRFFIKVGWMKKLEGSEVEQYNYRSFPGEFVWGPVEAEAEEGGGAPEGHLPLTNALRGTRLLESILTHPAFADGDDDVEEQMESVISKPLMGKAGFKPNYTF